MQYFLIWKEDCNFEEAKKIAACDEEEAAELWAKKTDFKHGDYPIANGHSQRVYVAKESKVEEKKLFEVIGYPVPTYEVTAL